MDSLLRCYPTRVARRCRRCGVKAYGHPHGICLECEPPEEREELIRNSAECDRGAFKPTPEQIAASAAAIRRRRAKRKANLAAPSGSKDLDRATAERASPFSRRREVEA